MEHLVTRRQVGVRLKEARENADLKQVDLGEILGVSQQRIGVWENGGRIPEKHYKLIAKHTGYDISGEEILHPPSRRGRGSITMNARAGTSYQSVGDMTIDTSYLPPGLSDERKELITLIPDAPESWVHESIIKLRKIRDIMQG